MVIGWWLEWGGQGHLLGTWKPGQSLLTSSGIGSSWTSSTRIGHSPPLITFTLSLSLRNAIISIFGVFLKKTKDLVLWNPAIDRDISNRSMPNT